MNIDKLAKAIEKDAGQAIPGLRKSLNEMKQDQKGRTYTPEQLVVISTRNILKLSQTDFAALINTPVGTLRDWEQGRFPPPGGVLCLLELLSNHPEMAQELAA